MELILSIWSCSSISPLRRPIDCDGEKIFQAIVRKRFATLCPSRLADIQHADADIPELFGTRESKMSFLCVDYDVFYKLGQLKWNCRISDCRLHSANGGPSSTPPRWCSLGNTDKQGPFENAGWAPTGHVHDEIRAAGCCTFH
jgi:hypothetical protein